MKTFFTYFSFFLVLSSCDNSNVSKGMVNSARKEFKRGADEFNSKSLTQEKFEDDLYKIAELNLDSGIASIDEILERAPNYASYHKIKGDFYFKYHDYQNAINSYSKAIQLEAFSNAIVFRASCYLNLEQYDSCLTDLRSFPEFNNDNYWYIGNYYEARQKLDSAVHFYQTLYKVDTLVYKYCKDRIEYLQTQANPKLFKELQLRDTGRVTIRFYSVE